MTRNFRLIWTIVAVVALTLGGCKRSTVAVYDVPKEPASPPAPSVASAPSSEVSKANVQWTKPEAWTELAPTSFRKGNYVYEGSNGRKAEITVSSFPGDVGGTLANVNRWRGQAGLSPVTNEELAQSLSRVSAGGQEGQIVDILPESSDPTAIGIVAAIFLYQGESWFLKMSGPQEVVASQRAAFEQFAQGLRFGDSNAAPKTAASAQSTSELAFDVPEGWTESKGSSMRIASYQIVKEGFSPADFAITSFPGDTGGLTANVNRWRQQLGLPAWSEQEIQEGQEIVESGEFSFLVFDLKPTSDAEKASVKERIFAAILKRNDRSWFFKMKGDVFLLETQQKKFRQVILTTRFESPSQSNDL